jgi:DNA-binding NtrC family response regulator
MRIIAATNRDLRRMVENQRFRDDLYRLNVFPDPRSAAARRAEDVPALVRYFVQRLARPMNRRIEVSDPDARALRRYAWPGNVRELASLIRRAMILAWPDAGGPPRGRGAPASGAAIGDRRAADRPLSGRRYSVRSNRRTGCWPARGALRVSA